MSKEIMLTSSSVAAEIKLKEAAATATSSDMAEAEATTKVITEDAATSTTEVEANESVVTDAIATETAEASGTEDAALDTVTDEVAVEEAVGEEVLIDAAVTEEAVTDEVNIDTTMTEGVDVAVDGKIVTGDGMMDGGYVDPGYTEGTMADPSLIQVDPLLSSWPFVIGISIAVLFVSIVLGAFLAKRRIKKGIEIYED